DAAPALSRWPSAATMRRAVRLTHSASIQGVARSAGAQRISASVEEREQPCAWRMARPPQPERMPGREPDCPKSSPAMVVVTSLHLNDFVLPQLRYLSCCVLWAAAILVRS